MIKQHGRLEISSSRLKANLERFRSRVGNARICATIKANAYGHGVREVLGGLRGAALDWACVYALPEAADVVACAPGLKVLVLSPVVVAGSDSWVGELPEHVRVTVSDVQTAEALAAAARRDATHPLAVHVQIDAGLTRAGATADEARKVVAIVRRSEGLTLEGMFAHFSHGDEPGHESVANQLEVLRAVAMPFKREMPALVVHVQNSGGAWHLGNAGLDMVRVGIGLYGLQPSMDDPIEALEPIARVVAPVLAIHERPAGVGVGYGHTFITRRASRLGIVPVGYADGYPRAMSSRGVVQVRGTEAPVVGRVSMDQVVVDLTDVKHATVGDEVVVISNDPHHANSVDRMAAACGTIGYEIATGFGHRLERRLVA